MDEARFDRFSSDMRVFNTIEEAFEHHDKRVKEREKARKERKERIHDSTKDVS